MSAICTDEMDGFGHALQCPQCGDIQIHLEAVAVEQHGDVILLAGSMVEAWAQRPSGARGAVIKIRCWGECGHTFTLMATFHKGSTYLTHDDLGMFSPDPSAPQQAELWRD